MALCLNNSHSTVSDTPFHFARCVPVRKISLEGEGKQPWSESRVRRTRQDKHMWCLQLCSIMYANKALAVCTYYLYLQGTRFKDSLRTVSTTTCGSLSAQWQSVNGDAKLQRFASCATCYFSVVCFMRTVSISPPQRFGCPAY